MESLTVKCLCGRHILTFGEHTLGVMCPECERYTSRDDIELKDGAHIIKEDERLHKV